MACDHRRSHVVDSRKKEGFVYRKRICSCGQHIYTKEYLVGEKNNGTLSRNKQKTPNISSELASIMGLAGQVGGTKQRIFSLFVRKIQIKLGVEEDL